VRAAQAMLGPQATVEALVRACLKKGKLMPASPPATVMPKPKTSASSFPTRQNGIKSCWHADLPHCPIGGGHSAVAEWRIARDSSKARPGRNLSLPSGTTGWRSRRSCTSAMCDGTRRTGGSPDGERQPRWRPAGPDLWLLRH